MLQLLAAQAVYYQLSAAFVTQKNAKIVPRLSLDLVLPNAFQFIIHQSAYHSTVRSFKYWHCSKRKHKTLTRPPLNISTLFINFLLAQSYRHTEMAIVRKYELSHLLTIHRSSLEQDS
jgi:hypothetical protein